MIRSGNDTVVQVFKAVDQHPTHAPEPAEGTALNAYSKMKRAAEDHPEAPPAQIIRSHITEVGVALGTQIGFVLSL